MKKLITIILLLFAFISNAQVSVVGSIVPAGGGLFPIVSDQYFGGGYRAVHDTVARDNITSLRRTFGMLVYDSLTNNTWQLKGDLTNGTSNVNWSIYRPSTGTIDSATVAGMIDSSSKKTGIYYADDFGGFSDSLTFANIIHSIPDSATLILGLNKTYTVPYGIWIDKPMKLVGNNSTIKVSTKDTGVINIESGYVTINGITIQGVYDTFVTTGYLIKSRNGDSTHYYKSIKITNCILKDCSAGAINLQYVDNPIIEYNTIDSIQYVGIEFRSARNGGIRFNKIIHILGVKTPSTNAYAITLTAEHITAINQLSANNEVSNNIVSDVPTWAGIDCHGGLNNKIHDNTIYNCLKSISCVVFGEGFNSSPKNISLNNNVINNDTLTNQDRLGIQLQGSASDGYATGTIDGNILIGSGIDGQYTSGLSINGNTIIRACNAYGIDLEHINKGFAIVGNSCEDVYNTVSGNTAMILFGLSANDTGFIGGNRLTRNGFNSTFVNSYGFNSISTSGSAVMWGINDFRGATIAQYNNATDPIFMTGAGTPLSIIAAPVGSLYLRTDGGAGTTLYLKEVGVNNVGWVNFSNTISDLPLNLTRTVSGTQQNWRFTYNAGNTSLIFQPTTVDGLFAFRTVGNTSVFSVNTASNISLTPITNVVIGASSSTATAALDIQSSTKGFIEPRMNTTQRNAISSPTKGTSVIDTTGGTVIPVIHNGTSYEKYALYGDVTPTDGNILSWSASSGFGTWINISSIGTDTSLLVHRKDSATAGNGYVTPAGVKTLLSGQTLQTVTNNGNVTTDTVYLAGLGIGTSGLLLAPIFVGNLHAVTSTDPQIVISRSIGNTVNDFDGNSHSFAENSNFRRSSRSGQGPLSNASFDDRGYISNNDSNANYNHHAAFQAGITYRSTAYISNIYGLVSVPTQTAGIVANLYAGCARSPVVTGNSTMINNYGWYADTSSVATANYGGYFSGYVGLARHIPLCTYTYGTGSNVAFQIKRDGATAMLHDQSLMGYSNGALLLAETGLEIIGSNTGDYVVNTMYLGTLAERTRTNINGFGIGTAPLYPLDVNGDIAQANSRIVSTVSKIEFVTRAGAAQNLAVGSIYINSSFGGTAPINGIFSLGEILTSTAAAYSSNLASTYTSRSLVDKNYVDSTNRINSIATIDSIAAVRAALVDTSNVLRGLIGSGGVPTSRTISTTSPLSGGGDLSANRTLSITNASADGTTLGVATFISSDFNASSGVISIDYTNGQEATASIPGFLSSSDWTTFNNKGNGTVTSITPNGGFASHTPITTTGILNIDTSLIRTKTQLDDSSAVLRSLIVSGTGGTVTSVSVTANNGITQSVATATTTPVITLGLGNITPTSIVSTGNSSFHNLVINGSFQDTVGSGEVFHSDTAYWQYRTANRTLRYGLDNSGNITMNLVNASIISNVFHIDASATSGFSEDANNRITFPNILKLNGGSDTAATKSFVRSLVFQDIAILSSGTVTVNNSNIQSGDIIMLTVQSPNGVLSTAYSVGTITPGVNFVINAYIVVTGVNTINTLDNSVIGYQFIHKN